MTISLGRVVCGDFYKSSDREWVETNGRGGYAMGTVSGANTRRYHGLLNLALRPPVDRFQTVNRLEESLLTKSQRVEISCQAYPGAIYPQGYKYLESFRLDPYPIWTYVAGETLLEKSFFLRYGEDTAVVLYELITGSEIVLEVRPLLTFRNHHSIIKEDERFHGRLDNQPNAFKVRPAVGPELWMSAKGGEFRHDSFWYRNQEYSWESRRGLGYREDAFSPGIFRFALKPGQAVALVITTKPDLSGDPIAWGQQERELRERLLDKSLARGPLADKLVRAADQFLVERNGGTSVIAGYPWFEDWGRDTMISLPGLCLATGRAQEAGEILETYAKHLSEGQLPNRFPEDNPSPDYTAADPSLWYVWAVQKYFQATGDAERVKALLPSLRQIVDAYQHGTPQGIRMDQDGLLSIPPSNNAYTWMDARVNGIPVTPRAGKPVEIQALWYNALQFLSELDLKFGEAPRGYEKLAAIARNSFNEKFWNESAQYLYDRIDGRERDGSIRPNALFAISLPYEILEENRFKPVVELALRELHTPYGMRSLAKSDPAYRARYEGPQEERDASYHQGSVWPWLLGSFVTAFVKANGSTEDVKAQVQEFLEPFRKHLSDAGLGQVSEIFEGAEPHAPQGCAAQAWSVAELLRILWEENLLL